MSKHKDDKPRVIFSTNPDFKAESDDNNEAEAIPANQQTLYVSVERLKGGKMATVIGNFIGHEADLEALGKQLKTKCGVGGTVKDGLIMIQGEQRDKVMGFLQVMGYKSKRKGG
jgi:translation initiation factor 1